MGSLVRFGAGPALALAFSACALGPMPPGGSAAELIGRSSTGDEYADFLAARYAGMTRNTSAAALYSVRAAGRAPHDAELLEQAAFAELVEGDAVGAAKLAARADAKTLLASPTAQLALIAEDIAAGRNAAALKRLEGAQLGVVNDDVARGLGAWLIAEHALDQGLGKLDAASRQSLARTGVYAGVQALILSSAKRDTDALAKFHTDVRSPDILLAAHIRLLAAQGDVEAAKKLLSSAYFPSIRVRPALERARAMLDAGDVQPLRLTTKQGAAAAIYLFAPQSGGPASPEIQSAYLALALRIDPDFESGRADLVEALVNQGRNQDAIDISHGFKAGSAYYGRAKADEAWLLRGLGRHDDAVAAAKAAVGASRRREVALSIANLLREEGKYSESEPLYTQVVKADFDENMQDWRALFGRADVFEKLGRWSEAEGDLKQALALSPDRPEILNFLGYAWIDRNEHVEEGFALIQRAMAVEPGQGYIVDSLGWAHYRRGDYEEAVAALEKATELEPADSTIADHLGDAYWRVGRRTEAGFEWRRALTLQPDAEQSAELEQKLSAGLPELASRGSDKRILGRP